ncbi:MAG TPA: DEAD/DEAH box helicase [Synergistaceae bacterium]|nr:DEAD/DEAH box helicase [Synergistaceae bacterium]HPQ36336.1 DEAD/DEAH box helicase [Synergistaceae bacterium]
MIRFDEFGFSPEILRAIEDLGFETPMPIQEKAIPLALETDRDIIGLAQTGTGKTAAFGLPLIQNVDLSLLKPQGLILAPTRELCLQICRDLQSFASHLPALRILAVYGGADAEPQINALRRGVHIIVATPGRMNDLLNKRRKIDLSAISRVILDEADEMLDMGFKDDLDAILSQTPENKKTSLFSATMPREMQEIAENYMTDPVEVSVGVKNSGSDTVEHLCHMVRSRDRYSALKRVVDFRPEIYGIVFCRTRQETKDVAQKLINDGYDADALHGDLSQNQREYIMQKFRQKNLQLLVATDVAARGLDVQGITHVVHYNLPDDPETYTHRSGRTGRAGNEGISIAIINLKEKHKIHSIERNLKRKFSFLSVPKGKDICEKQLLHLIDKVQSTPVDHEEIEQFLPMISKKLEHLGREELIKMFLSLEFDHFLSYYKDAEDLSAPDRQRDSENFSSQRSSSRERGSFNRQGNFARLFINLGAMDGLTPKELISFVTGQMGKRGLPLGKIDITKSFSFFEVPQEEETQVLKALHKSTYKNRKVVVEPSNKSRGSSSSKRSFQDKRSFRNNKNRKVSMAS